MRKPGESQFFGRSDGQAPHKTFRSSVLVHCLPPLLPALTSSMKEINAENNHSGNVHPEGEDNRGGIITKAIMLMKNKPINYYSVRFGYFVILMIISSLLIYYFEREKNGGNYAYIDVLFLCISAFTATGLSTISTFGFSPQTFGVIGFLMFFGSIFFHVIPPLIARQYYNRKVLAQYKDRIEEIDPQVIEEHNKLNDALKLSIGVCISYLLSWQVLIFVVYYGALHLHPQEPELVERGYSRVQDAAFVAASAFSNTGLTISSSSVYYIANNPLAYCALMLAIVAGNTCIAPFLYFSFWSLLKVYDFSRLDASAIRYVFQNPTKICQYTLSWEATRHIFFAMLAINIVQYVFFLPSAVYPSVTLNDYGSMAKVAGMLSFQTISTRTCGMQVLKMFGRYSI